ncbi:MAG: ABC transporter permease, partial [Thermoanaerobaculia bacterium]
MQSLRQTVRSLAKHPLISISAILTLAIAIGANTAIFSVVNGLLFERLPFRDPDGIAVLWQDAQHDDRLPVSLPDYFDWKERASTFSAMGAYRSIWVPLGLPEGARHVDAVQATWDVFEVLGLPLKAGRTFSEAEEKNGEHVAIVGEHVWRELGRDGLGPDSEIRLDGTPYRVIGIMDMSFSLPWISDPDLWIPMGRPESLMNRAAHSNTLVVGRLAEGRELGEALAEIQAISAELSKQYPETNGAVRSGGDLLASEMRRDYRAPILLLWASVFLVLLIACANVMNLLLVRGEARRRELAVRRAMGASRSRIARQILSESVLLAAAGALGGLLIATLAVPLLERVNDSRTMAGRIEIDAAVLGFTIAAALLTAVLSGLIPALRQSKESVGGRDSLLSTRGGSTRISRAMLVAQIALALVLTTASVLMIASFRNMIATDPGFDVDGVIHAGLSIPAGASAGADDREQTWLRILETARTLPGVEAASFS